MDFWVLCLLPLGTKTSPNEFATDFGIEHFLGNSILILLDFLFRRHKVHEITFSKGFLQNEVFGEVSVLEGGSSGRSFSRSLPRSFSRSFRPCFAGTFRAKKNFSKTSALSSHDPAQQNWRNFREKLHDEVLQGDPRQNYLKIIRLE